MKLNKFNSAYKEFIVEEGVFDRVKNFVNRVADEPSALTSTLAKWGGYEPYKEPERTITVSTLDTIMKFMADKKNRYRDGKTAPFNNLQYVFYNLDTPPQNYETFKSLLARVGDAESVRRLNNLYAGLDSLKKNYITITGPLANEDIIIQKIGDNRYAYYEAKSKSGVTAPTAKAKPAAKKKVPVKPVTPGPSTTP